METTPTTSSVLIWDVTWEVQLLLLLLSAESNATTRKCVSDGTTPGGRLSETHSVANPRNKRAAAPSTLLLGMIIVGAKGSNNSAGLERMTGETNQQHIP
uniref:Secreted protein n=1 Tax=Pseudo-nitzschia australis TaxID=44445 RepID=A0A7S4APE2_9STRA